MAAISGFFLIAYVVFVVGIFIYALWLITRFVGAHERAANSLDVIARKMRDEGRP